MRSRHGECLHSIDRSSVPDQFGGTDVFSWNRKLIKAWPAQSSTMKGRTLPMEVRRVVLLIVRADDIPDFETHQ
jgi:hypothetical protein